METAVIIGASWFGIGFVEPLRLVLSVTSVGALYLLGARWPMGWLAFALALCLSGFPVSEWAGRLSETVDDGRIVIDEVAAAALMLAIARPRAPWLAISLCAAFIVLDGLKPWPLAAVEALPGGFGVMLDDLVLGAAIGCVVVLARAISARRSPPSAPRRSGGPTP